MIHGGSCLDEEERVYAVEIFVVGCGVGRFTSLPVVWTRRVIRQRTYQGPNDAAFVRGWLRNGSFSSQ